MAHSVQMVETKHKITNRDVIFSVRRGSKKLGELRVSKGNLVWITGNGRYVNYITWKDFDAIMTKGGTLS